MFNFAKDNSLDFHNIQLLKDNSNELNNNNIAKDNSLDLYQLLPKTTLLDLEKLAQLTMICCSQLEDRQSLL